MCTRLDGSRGGGKGGSGGSGSLKPRYGAEEAVRGVGAGWASASPFAKQNEALRGGEWYFILFWQNRIHEPNHKPAHLMALSDI